MKKTGAKKKPACTDYKRNGKGGNGAYVLFLHASTGFRTSL